MVLQKRAVFILNDFALRTRDEFEQFFADITLLDQIVPEGLANLEAVSLQRNSK